MAGVVSGRNAFQFKTVAVASTAVDMLTSLGFTQAELDSAYHARITAGAQPIRFRYNGVAATAAVGHYLAANSETEVFSSDNITKLSFIAVSTASDVFITLER